MGLERTAGIVIIIGSILFFFATIPLGQVFREPSSQKRLELIEDNPTRWLVSQVSFSIGALVAAVGFVLFSLHIGAGQSRWLTYLAASSFLVGAILWSIYVYLRTVNPEVYMAAGAISWTGLAYFVLTELAIFLYGIVFLRSDYPNWLGYLTIGFAAIFLIAAMISRAVLIPLFFYILTLVVGIRILRG